MDENKIERMYVKPGEGKRVRDPRDPKRVLPVEGRWVPKNQYWTRRKKDKDVVECEAPPKKKREAAAKDTDAGGVESAKPDPKTETAATTNRSRKPGRGVAS